MIPILVTVDLEIAQDYNVNEQKLILHKIFGDLHSMEIPLTVFTTSEVVDIFPEQIKMIYTLKNEIGCHGLFHDKEENYKTASEKKIIKNITTTSKNIEDKIQEKPICFRGPFMSTSSITQSVLIKNGYLADFSVCSQRFDIFNSKGGDIGWLFAPRFPYRSSEKSPYKKGNLPIWNIPLSCIGLPFISGLLYLLGIKFMKNFFLLLLKESLKTQKPIVYLFHSYEFTNYIGFKKDCNKKTGIKRNKQSFIHKFYTSDPVKRYNMNIDLLRFMLSFNSVNPITGKTYIKMLNGEIN
jgi:hypothetical protein